MINSYDILIQKSTINPLLPILAPNTNNPGKYPLYELAIMNIDGARYVIGIVYLLPSSRP